MVAKNEKILIVEDQPGEVKLIKMALERENYEVVCPYYGKEGFAKAKQERPDEINDSLKLKK